MVLRSTGQRDMRQIGITTTVPVELVLAAGFMPVDLNNVFVANCEHAQLVDIAERDGFPRNCCAWIKGIYGVCVTHAIDRIMCVTTGDCSNTVMLMEVLKLKGFEVVPFAYPDVPNVMRVQAALNTLAETLGTTLDRGEEVRMELAGCRCLTDRLDELTWREGVVSSLENHWWLVSSSDFGADHVSYERELGEFLSECCRRRPYSDNMLRLAYIGVPPIFAQDLYQFLEEQEARVVFNEVQRQFAMPCRGGSLSEQYANYTYPYSIFDRLRDISCELRRRRVDGVIHYVQSFCHRAIGDIIFRDAIDLPLLTLEGDTSYILTKQLEMRLEAFLEMLRQRM